MSTINILKGMTHELMLSMNEMTVDELNNMSSLIDRSLHLMRKGDEGLLELYDWLENRKDISYEDALLLLFDYLGIQ